MKFQKRKTWVSKCPSCGQVVSCQGVTFVLHIGRGKPATTCPGSNTRAEYVIHRRKAR